MLLPGRDPQTYDPWHDRAAFHFLADDSDLSAHVGHLKKTVRSGGHVIIGTFAPDVPERCSGLPIMRYASETLRTILGNASYRGAQFTN
jgi:hypothetical protein